MSTSSNEADANPLRGYFSTSSIDDLTYVPPLNPQGTRACSRLASANTGRKSWKTLREKREAVWPPFIEAALFEALEKYRPRSSINTELLRRFPKRNRYISDYILKVTGKARTPKQVGSRLQQLRDTCSDKRVLALISRREFSPDPRSEGERCPSVFSNTSSWPSSRGPSLFSAPSTPSRIAMSSPFTDNLVQEPESHTTSQCVPPPQRYVTIELHSSDPSNPPQNQTRASALRLKIPEFPWENASFPAPSASPISTSPPSSMISSLTSPFNYSPVSPSPSSSSSHPSTPALPYNSHVPPLYLRLRIAAPTPLWDHIPSATFSSPTPLVATEHYAFFCVFLGDAHVHSEVADLALIHSPGAYGGLFTYATKLVPRYWARLCQQGGLARCTVTQDVMRAPHPVLDGSDEHVAARNAVVLSIVYNFECASGLLQEPAADLDIPLSPRTQYTNSGPALPPDFPDVPIYVRAPAVWVEDSISDARGSMWYTPSSSDKHPQPHAEIRGAGAASGWSDGLWERWGVVDPADACTYTYHTVSPRQEGVKVALGAGLRFMYEHDISERAWSDNHMWG